MTTPHAPGQAPESHSPELLKSKSIGEASEKVIKGATDAVSYAAKRVVDGVNLKERVDGALSLVGTVPASTVNPKRALEKGVDSLTQIVTGEEKDIPSYVEITKDTYGGALEVVRGAVQAQFGSPIKGSKRAMAGASRMWSGKKAA